MNVLLRSRYVIVKCKTYCKYAIKNIRLFANNSNSSSQLQHWIKSLNNNLKYTQLQRLPVDESLTPIENRKPRLVTNASFTKVDPTPIQSPNVLSISSALQECLHLNTSLDDITDEFKEIFSGNIETINKIIPNCTPYSHCYAGHQFGNFVGQLGDGRAICLGEYVNDNNERWEIQLKGCGLTPYSRFADGRAVLRSSIREYLMSEAMHYLNIPTTRAGALIISDTDKVIRDEFYNGNPKQEILSIVTRLAPSYIRFGSFEICSDKGGPSYDYNNETEMKNIIKSLLDYVIEYHYNHIWIQYKQNVFDENKMYELWFEELVDRTVNLVVKWQCIGFIHGVLNTDNMSILGLTIDYGPFGFMEYFNSNYIPNYSDKSGRYSYYNQVKICQWNLNQLAEVFDDLDIISSDITNKYIIDDYYDTLYDKYYKDTIKLKLFGDVNLDNDIDKIIELFFDTMSQTGCDFTNAFRSLNMLSINGINTYFNNSKSITLKECMDIEDDNLLNYIINQCATPLQYGLLKNHHKSTQIISLHRNLPYFRKMADYLKSNASSTDNIRGLTLNDIEEVLNYFARNEIDGDNINNIAHKNEVTEMTINEKKEFDRNLWKLFINEYRLFVNNQYIGNNEDEMFKMNENRIKIMNENNPKYILRNYMLQNCINNAEIGDYKDIELLLEVIKNPFEEQTIAQNNNYDNPAPGWNISDCISCSS